MPSYQKPAKRDPMRAPRSVEKGREGEEGIGGHKQRRTLSHLKGCSVLYRRQRIKDNFGRAELCFLKFYLGMFQKMCHLQEILKK